MKEKEKIDQWLQKSMADFRPELSDSARERFLSEAPVKGSRAFNGRLYGTLAIVLLLSVSTLIWWTSESSDKSPVNADKQKTSSADQVQKPHEAIKDVTAIVNREVSASSDNYESGKTIANSSAGSDVFVDAAMINNSTQESTGLSTVDQHKDNTESKAEVSNPQIEATAEYKTEPVITREQELIQLLTENLSKSDGSTAEQNRYYEKDTITEPSGKKEKEENKVSRFMNQSLSLYYRPEVVWNVIDNEKLIHNFGAEWQTRLFSGNYLLGTGVGISLTRGYYEYAIEYNEFLGNYQQLDSITFEWNPREFSMSQTVHTSQETVFDTAVKVDYARVYRDFVYLQIPFTMGYDIVHKSKYSVGVRFVPVLSILLSKKPVDFRYEAGNDRIVQINRITPDRVKTNWQLNAGLNYSRRLSETFWMELEPRFSYYFNSVYEKSDNSLSPMGASIRVAFGIKY